ncbi:MAG: tRNA-dihydrouridine synthase family protein, partial [Lachnospiraceae bacterium]|nr:tRNA-dihydrouridine synthase family protein [Lachnospiraceae bacterium]
MEGITNYLFRSVYHRHFTGIDTYFTPFVTGTHLSKKEQRDILKENNPGMKVVVQVLSNQTDDFLSVAHIVSEEFGYDHINLNLGCPSNTVTSRKRGAGFLSVPDKLEQFLDEIFERSPITISVKTRIGMHDASGWENILALYEKYPMTELIVHPRIRDALYGGLPDLDAFDLAYQKSSHPLCYNGNLFHLADYERIRSRFPKLPAVMIGRGLLINPFLPEEIKQSAISGTVSDADASFG